MQMARRQAPSCRPSFGATLPLSSHQQGARHHACLNACAARKPLLDGLPVCPFPADVRAPGDAGGVDRVVCFWRLFCLPGLKARQWLRGCMRACMRRNAVCDMIICLPEMAPPDVKLNTRCCSPSASALSLSLSAALPRTATVGTLREAVRALDPARDRVAEGAPPAQRQLARNVNAVLAVAGPADADVLALSRALPHLWRAIPVVWRTAATAWMHACACLSFPAVHQVQAVSLSLSLCGEPG